MTLSTLMISPSIWMQKTFFNMTEKEDLFGRDRDDCGGTITIRVAAVAHAALQLAYAVVVVVPLCLVTAVTICFHTSSTGFCTQYGGVLERLALGVVAAAASVFVPVAASIGAAMYVQQLKDPESFAVSMPILFHGLLLSFTLPEITKMPESESFISATQGIGRSLSVFFGSDKIAEDLQEAISRVSQKAYRWRFYMPVCILDEVRGDISCYDRAFNHNSREYTTAFLNAVGKALQGAASEDVAEDGLWS
jgi:hypothetical protein